MALNAAAAADSTYAATVKSARVSFSVGSNVPFIEVSGASMALRGRAEATSKENRVIVQNLRFELDPSSIKTGNGLRDRHMQEKVFTADDGSTPTLVLAADRFEAQLEPQTSRWEGELRAQFTMRGLTHPISFHVTARRQGNAAIVAAEGVVKTSDFAVKPITNAGIRVRDEVTVHVSDLVLVPELSRGASSPRPRDRTIVAQR